MDTFSIPRFLIGRNSLWENHEKNESTSDCQNRVWDTHPQTHVHIELISYFIHKLEKKKLQLKVKEI